MSPRAPGAPRSVTSTPQPSASQRTTLFRVRVRSSSVGRLADRFLDAATEQLAQPSGPGS